MTIKDYYIKKTEPQVMSDDLSKEDETNFAFDANHKVELEKYETWEDLKNGKPVEEKA